ncbi:hypothetical protein GCM10023229_09350 [Flavisolibacter ginsenosidimutans]
MIAACFWARANFPDSAFTQLEIVASNGRYVDFDFTSSGNLNSLHNDKRWPEFVDRIKKFDLPSLCTHTYNPPSPIPIVFTVDPKSIYFKSDTYGDYLNDFDNVSSVSTHAYNLRILRSDKGEFSKRSLILDLRQPVINSGATSQGVIKDSVASFHVFYKFDTTVRPWVVYNFRDMPIGSTIISPRTEIFVHINGNSNKLQLGYWGLGDCNEKDGKGMRNGGEGTTGVQVTRNSESEYTIEAQDGSIGRLWDITNPPFSIDKGLFKTGFLIHLKYQ